MYLVMSLLLSSILISLLDLVVWQEVSSLSSLSCFVMIWCYEYKGYEIELEELLLAVLESFHLVLPWVEFLVEFFYLILEFLRDFVHVTVLHQSHQLQRVLRQSSFFCIILKVQSMFTFVSSMIFFYLDYNSLLNFINFYFSSLVNKTYCSVDANAICSLISAWN